VAVVTRGRSKCHPQAKAEVLSHYRVPVASQDPIVAITCVLHSSGDAALAAPADGQPGLLRDDGGLDDDEDVSRGPERGATCSRKRPDFTPSYPGPATQSHSKLVTYVTHAFCQAGRRRQSG
jgi:hypothetical protein